MKIRGEWLYNYMIKTYTDLMFYYSALSRKK